MEELKSRFPEGLEYGIYHDTTPFIRESVADVITTLLVAIVLVALVVLLFLQDWRATLIPLIAVPVAIVGTFGVMAVLQFSLNNISLFGLVLAIGIVVDDAIVVVENVERWLEQGLDSKEAARRAMDEVTGPVIAVALVLCAVFLPCAFISGITGQFFRQFAVTIAVSTIISALNSLTLSPALAAILLKPHGAKRDPLAFLLHVTLGWFFRALQQGLPIRNAVLCPDRRHAAAGLCDGDSGLCRAIGRDRMDVHLVSGRVHSTTGPRLVAGELPIARFGLFAAYERSSGQHRPHHAGGRWRTAHDRRGRLVAAADRQQFQFRLDVRDPATVRRAPASEAARRRDHGAIARAVCRRDPRRVHQRVRLRPCRESAWPADSS